MAWMQVFWLLALSALVAILWLVWYRNQHPLRNEVLLSHLALCDYPTALTDSNGAILWINPQARRLWQPATSMVVYQSAACALPLQTDILDTLHHTPFWRGDVWLTNRYRSHLTVQLLPRQTLLWQLNDQQILAQPAQVTELPTLLSDDHFQQHFHWLLQQHIEKNQQLTLMLLQVDEMPRIRRLLGPTEANQLLEQLLHRMLPELPIGAVLHRLDESRLAILFHGGSHPGNTILTCQRVALDLLAFCHGPFLLSEADCTLDCCIGVAIAPQAGTDEATLLRNAGLALLQAANQPNRLQIWQPGTMPEQAAAFPEFDLEQVLGQYQCQLWYQPVVDISSAVAICYRIELRWQAPRLGLLTYSQLQPLARESGHLLVLERWGFSHLCQQLALWQHQTQQPVLQYAVGADNLLHLGFPAFIREQLEDFSIAPSQIVLCCDEQAFLQDTELFLQQTNQLRQLGIGLLLEGVGDGLTPLKLLSLPCWSGAELAPVLQNAMEDSDQQRNICASLVRLLLNSGLKVQACGVKQELSAYLLQVMGAETARGDCFAAMQPLNNLFAAEQSWRNSA